MTNYADKALLPAGMCDVLSPDAAFEAEAVESIMACFAGHGYDRVKPPLIEFEESLLSDNGAAMTGQTFRLMDPVSQRMMGVRADMTVQVARIATTRLANAPRPLRLSYAGQVLRVKGSQLRPERQFGQVGAELIGSSATGADVEVILMAVAALENLGVAELSVDLGLPSLVPAVCAGLELDAADSARLQAALDHKDVAGVSAMKDRLGAQATDTLSALLNALGPAPETLSALHRLALPPAAAALRETLARVADDVTAGAPALQLTIDAVENRGLEYHTGVTFAIFAPGVRGELGSGGHYVAGSGIGTGEPATGLTLFMDTVMRALPAPARARRVFVPHGAPLAEDRRLRAEGWVTVRGVEPAADGDAEARRLGCDHVLADGTPRPVDGGGG